jgi:MFS family permease
VAPGSARLRLYGVYFPLSRLFFEAPVFFLYLSERFPLDRVLWLEALYFFGVVVLEVPSGYLSDRVGRALTLRIGTGARIFGYLLFLAGEGFAAFALAQLALAFHWASLSGTDTSYHYDSLLHDGLQREYGEREARLGRNAWLAGAASAVLGGIAGAVDLRLAYALGLALAIVSFGVALRMDEPPRPSGGFASGGPLRQLRACARSLRDPLLGWIFAFVVVMLTLEHVPYEFAQPYLALVLGESPVDTRWTPLGTGLLTAAFQVVAALAAARSIGIGTRFGLAPTLLAATALQSLLIAAMAVAVHPLVLLLLILRDVQPAVSMVLVHATCAPRVPQAQRATYLSLQSLAGRLGFSVVLLALGAAAPDRAADESTLRPLLGACALLAVLSLAALAATRGALRDARVAA